MPFYCSEAFNRSVVWPRSSPKYTDLDEAWRKWVLIRFYQAAVFKLFDLGDLAFCPDREAEKAWRDLFGQAGLLKHFRIGSRTASWGSFWSSIETGARAYLQRAEEIVRKHAALYPPEQSFILHDALEYGWIPELLPEFQRILAEDLWREGILDREDPTKLSPRVQEAEQKMLLGGPHGQV